ncbi:MAG: hypothetical protein GY940_10850 [bacterium]|nr:hypothetical protein [bacterium]
MVANASSIYGDSITIKINACVNDVYYNQLNNNGTIRGNMNSPLALPLIDTLPPFPASLPGFSDIDITGGTTLILAPGSYGKVLVRANATLILTGGVYQLENLDLGSSNSQVLFQAASDVIINNHLQPGAGAIIGPQSGSGISPGDIWFYVNGTDGGNRAAVIGINNDVKATIYAPYGTIWIKSGTLFEGALIGKDVIIGINVVVTLGL